MTGAFVFKKDGCVSYTCCYDLDYPAAGLGLGFSSSPHFYCFVKAHFGHNKVKQGCFAHAQEAKDAYSLI